MSPRKGSKVRIAGAGEAEDRLQSARAFRRAAENQFHLAESDWDFDPVVSNCVLAAIAAADAACARALGEYSASIDHGDAVGLLKGLHGSTAAVNALRRLLGDKAKAQYQSGRCTRRDAELSLQRCATVIEFAETIML